MSNDNCNYNSNNIVENSINNSSSNNINDYDNSSIYGNNNSINYNDINNECNNTCELSTVTNIINRNNYRHRNLDSSNIFINLFSRSLNSNLDDSSSNCRGVYYFLLSGQKKI